LGPPTSVLAAIWRAITSEPQYFEAWSNGSVNVLVGYRDGKVILKAREVYQPWWKIKAREWLDWLRGLVVS
jgi:hypothetical protein